MISRPDRAASVAVILPCCNEAETIDAVVTGFQSSLPGAEIYVFDNNSTDDTVARARAAGAAIYRVDAQGKGNVLRQAFALIEADVYVLADGDGTYEAAKARVLVDTLLRDGLDMVVGVRRHDDIGSDRRGHAVGNRIFNGLVRMLFARETSDLFSGYRVLSRPFVKSFPALASGFETETEMSVHAIQLGLPFAEIGTAYRPRRVASQSKLHTLRDGLRIFSFMLRLLKHMRPMFLFLPLSGALALVSLILGAPIIVEYAQTGLVPRFPTAIAASALMVIAAVGFVSGLILDGIAYAQREQKRLAYLAVERRTPRYQSAGGRRRAR